MLETSKLTYINMARTEVRARETTRSSSPLPRSRIARTWCRIAAAALLVTVVLVLGMYATRGAAAGPTRATFSTPIRHVVILYQENHSFDNVFGQLCVTDHRCDGVTSGKLPNGATIPLKPATDIVPPVNHEHGAQQTAIAGGKMDGFANLTGCSQTTGYACYSQYAPSQIPNLAALARTYAISDHTFEMHAVPSWGAHLELVTQNLDGFTGDNPTLGTTGKTGSGWGCDSYRDATWRSSPTAAVTSQPSCIPDYALSKATYPYGGAYRSTPVNHVPTIMDELNQAGLSWKLYATGGPGQLPYGWDICPTFAECLYTSQHQDQVPSAQVITDAAAGTLPNFSIVLPAGPNSQHNTFSMLQGDNWIGQIISAIQHGPDWNSTAIFITYDDCGCFYDHVPPPAGDGIRVPMIIVSPYARPGYTDTTTATFSSMLAYTEHAFNIPPLSIEDATAYPYTNAFNYTQTPLPPTPMTHAKIPATERRYLKAHPPNPHDPT
jgi:phospholipase C